MRILQPIALIFAATVWLGTATSCSHKSASAADDVSGKETAAEAAYDAPQAGNISIVKKWTMPAELLEISGISWMDDQRIACVQDERGSLFIYNLAASKIEKEIPFAGPGDYEAVSKAGDHFFVMRADGHIYEIDPAAAKPVVKEYDAVWEGKHDIEAMSYDGARNRLLIADKMDGTSIYAFDLASGRMSTAPVYELAMSDGSASSDESNGKKGGGKKKGGKKDGKDGGRKGKNALHPSAMATDPKTGDIYMADGPEATLVVLDKTGKTKRIIKLNKSDFPQPEGLTISPKGDVFLSSEGVKGNGVIARITL